MIWDYIRRKLAFIPVLKPGPLAALTEGAAESLDAARSDILFLRRAVMPETADADSLAVIAGRRGILRWPNESLDAYRIRATIAWLYWKTGGNPRGLTDILHAFGYEDVQVIEHIGEIWAEISVATGINHAVPDTSYLVRLINDVKPARTRLRGLNLSSGIEGRASVGPTVVKSQVRNKITTASCLRQDFPVGVAALALTGTQTVVTAIQHDSSVEGVLGVDGIIGQTVQTCISLERGLEVYLGVITGCLVKTTIYNEIKG